MLDFGLLFRYYNPIVRYSLFKIWTDQCLYAELFFKAVPVITIQGECVNAQRYPCWKR